MAQRFTPVRHVSLLLTAGEAIAMHAQLKRLTPDDIIDIIGPEAGADDALAVGRATKRIKRLGTKGGRIKFTLVEAGALLVTIEGLERWHAPAIKTRLGVELARQGGAKVGRR